MSHRITWDNQDKTVVLHEYILPADTHDLLELAQESNIMLQSVSHTVHLILDERSIKLMLTASELKYIEALVPKNQGAVVMVLSPDEISYKMLTQKLGKIVAPNAVNQSYFASTIEEARALLQDKFDVRYP